MERYEQECYQVSTETKEENAKVKPHLKYSPGDKYEGCLVVREIVGRLPRKEESFYLRNHEELPKGLEFIDNMNKELADRDKTYWFDLVTYFGGELEIPEEELDTMWRNFEDLIVKKRLAFYTGRQVIFQASGLLKYSLRRYINDHPKRNYYLGRLGSNIQEYMDKVFGPNRPRTYVMV